MTARKDPFANRTAATAASTTEPTEVPTAPRVPAPVAVPSGKECPPNVIIYQAQDDTARNCGDLRLTNPEVGDRSLSDFIHKAAMAEVERSEKKYNGGQPFLDLEAGSISRGRPMGE